MNSKLYSQNVFPVKYHSKNFSKRSSKKSFSASQRNHNLYSTVKKKNKKKKCLNLKTENQLVFKDNVPKPVPNESREITKYISYEHKEEEPQELDKLIKSRISNDSKNFVVSDPEKIKKYKSQSPQRKLNPSTKSNIKKTNFSLSMKPKNETNSKSLKQKNVNFGYPEDSKGIDEIVGISHSDFNENIQILKQSPINKSKKTNTSSHQPNLKQSSMNKNQKVHTSSHKSNLKQLSINKNINTSSHQSNKLKNSKRIKNKPNSSKLSESNKFKKKSNVIDMKEFEQLKDKLNSSNKNISKISHKKSSESKLKKSNLSYNKSPNSKLSDSKILKNESMSLKKNISQVLKNKSNHSKIKKSKISQNKDLISPSNSVHFQNEKLRNSLQLNEISSINSPNSSINNTNKKETKVIEKQKDEVVSEKCVLVKKQKIVKKNKFHSNREIKMNVPLNSFSRNQNKRIRSPSTKNKFYNKILDKDHKSTPKKKNKVSKSMTKKANNAVKRLYKVKELKLPKSRLSNVNNSPKAKPWKNPKFNNNSKSIVTKFIKSIDGIKSFWENKKSKMNPKLLMIDEERKKMTDLKFEMNRIKFFIDKEDKQKLKVDKKEIIKEMEESWEMRKKLKEAKVEQILKETEFIKNIKDENWKDIKLYKKNNLEQENREILEQIEYNHNNRIKNNEHLQNKKNELKKYNDQIRKENISNQKELKKIESSKIIQEKNELKKKYNSHLDHNCNQVQKIRKDLENELKYYKKMFEINK